MKKSKFTESQIISILKRQGAGAKVLDLCRDHDIIPPTFYNWRSNYGDLDTLQLSIRPTKTILQLKLASQL